VGKWNSACVAAIETVSAVKLVKRLRMQCYSLVIAMISGRSQTIAKGGTKPIVSISTFSITSGYAIGLFNFYPTFPLSSFTLEN
jgi:hypothetical protein